MAKSGRNPRGLYRRGEVYYARIAGPDGRLVRKRLSSDRQVAIILLGEMRKRFELQKAGILPEGMADEIKSFSELRLRYLEHLKARDVSENTRLSFDAAYKQVITRNRFANLRDMHLRLVEDWARRMVGGGVRGQTVNHYVGHIKRALRWAQENGYTQSNPLANWRQVRLAEPRRRRDFQPEEIARFFEAEENPELQLRWLIYFTTALRASAGTGIRWEWLDLGRGLLRLPVEANKSHRMHEIPLNRTLAEALERKAKEAGGKPRGMVFPAMTTTTLLRRFQRTCRRAGLDTEGLCLHSIRHTVATMLYRQTGKNLKAVQEVLGHVNPGTTMRYLHVTEEEKRAAIDSLDLGIEIK